MKIKRSRLLCEWKGACECAAEKTLHKFPQVFTTCIVMIHGGVRPFEFGRSNPVALGPCTFQMISFLFAASVSRLSDTLLFLFRVYVIAYDPRCDWNLIFLQYANLNLMRKIKFMDRSDIDNFTYAREVLMRMKLQRWSTVERYRLNGFFGLLLSQNIQNVSETVETSF